MKIIQGLTVVAIVALAVVFIFGPSWQEQQLQKELTPHQWKELNHFRNRIYDLQTGELVKIAGKSYTVCSCICEDGCIYAINLAERKVRVLTSRWPRKMLKLSQECETLIAKGI